jgi:site-specific DNA-methyltransferase (adenine-specific)
MHREADLVGVLRREFGPTLDYRRPAWGRAIRHELREAFEQATAVRPIACLVPFRPDTGWSFEMVSRGEVRLLRGRVRLTGHGGSPPFPSAVVVFGRPPAFVWWEPEAAQLRLALGAAA